MGAIPNSPFAAICSLMPLLDYSDTGAVAQLAVDRLDALDGDPDLEPSGDELDGDPRAEDEFVIHPRGVGAGCPLSDPPEANGDELDGDGAEDEPCAWHPLYANGPGCIVSDSDRDDCGEAEDTRQPAVWPLQRAEAANDR